MTLAVTPLPNEHAPGERSAVDENELTLDLRVITDSLPMAKMACSTSDNCGGSTCGSACTSHVTQPL
ncbi:FxLD family lanthipeptide [Labedaea rhizosphaerae]|uniref:FxLD family lantipeptide n=1 Tax=Labedaea rhizosphaerae TaxID=598644 RepID=A0A4R6SIE6_LABRH|nr:FxLD family lanthipeptide [Labedaea rhizosphaerae]TDQ00649.1 FxLD family lantipeptide [Labedaea rhizosphaerae]